MSITKRTSTPAPTQASTDRALIYLNIGRPHDENPDAPPLPEWARALAWDVAKLIREKKAMPRFVEQVRAWSADREAEYRAEQEWQRRRNECMNAADADERRRDRDAEPPAGMAWIHLCGPGGEEMAAWGPADLDEAARPRLTNGLTEGQVPIRAKYALLAALRDQVVVSADRVDPWPGDPDEFDELLKAALYGRLRRELARLCEDERLGEPAFRDFLADVDGDLASQGERRSRLSREEQVAYSQHARAAEALAEAGEKPTLAKCHEWLTTHGDNDPLHKFATWKRTLTRAKSRLGEQRNSPRAGREHGRSIVHADEVEWQPGDQ